MEAENNIADTYYRIGIRDAYVNLFMMFAVDGKEETLKKIATDFSGNLHTDGYLKSLAAMENKHAPIY